MQNLTTKFNILYHANKLLNEAEKNRIGGYKENYQRLLPIFIEPYESSITTNNHAMDSVIQKAITIINDKSDSKYVNDAYFLMAKANFEKGNYYHAAEFFSYVANTVNEQQGKLLELSLVWKGKSLLQIGYLQQAGKALDSALMITSTRKNIPPLYYATKAQYLLAIGDNENATDLLNQAIATSNKKKEKLRWHYLIGQLLQKKNNYLEADLHFNKVVKSNASFEMAFNAGLNQIDMQKITGDSLQTNTFAKLSKMIRNDKYKDFTDQIYYIIGETYLANNNEGEAIKHYNLSLSAHSNNSFQRAKTYNRLADLYFDQAAYQLAKNYYDSTLTLASSDFPKYNIIRAKVDHLDDLIAQYTIIAEQDELQKLAELPENSRINAVDSIFERKETIQKDIVKNDTPQANTNVFDGQHLSPDHYTGHADNRFYFNNPAAISSGTTAFKRRWGNRSLTDNWRFSNSNSSNTGTEDHPTSAAPQQELVVNNIETLTSLKENFIRTIPLTSTARDSSNRKIIDAHLSLGEIYRDNLRDGVAAIKIYTQLIDRFPELKEKDLIDYNLYRLYTEQGDEKQEYHKEQLLISSPESIYTKIIRDPQYLDKLAKESQVLNDIYTTAYNLYVDRKYQQVMQLADSLNTIIENDQYKSIYAQMAYLRAMAVGKTKTMEIFETSLKNIQLNYPDDQLIVPLVSQHLNYIDSNRLSLQDRNIALMVIEEGREQFVDEPILTKWPELVFNHQSAGPSARRILAGNLPGNQPEIQVTPFNRTVSLGKVNVGAYQRPQHTNSFRDLDMLPDSATYCFVINVASAKVNLSPSRYGIGQFNRGQYSSKNLMHQIKRVDDELQLLYISKFNTFDEVIAYQERISPLLKTIMKIPSGSYHTFIITEHNLQLLTDFDQVNDYFIKYTEQF
ncbi:tetratricopeptide repeat protein [Olivibacter sp. SDN3]|uniref:type IX secretion system periplasmic lipoprotein PorW/SprE n=1 Tax=Olivibacter sp. SDN3 TaxID=2764720 RepID=UPI001651307A|nr:tetratricopeptide repeat protein [Olivibacter sp. SDN3]QNL50034.1 tetratricopeptide repeat protein [Olivibacter sp. SDN3]